MQQLLLGMPREEQEMEGRFRVEVIDRDVGFVEAYNTGWREGFGRVGVSSKPGAAAEGRGS